MIAEEQAARMRALVEAADLVLAGRPDRYSRDADLWDKGALTPTPAARCSLARMILRRALAA